MSELRETVHKTLLADVDPLAGRPIHCIGVVLAGGKSSRMGKDKAQMRLGNKSLLKLATDKLTNIGCTKVYVSGDGRDITDTYPQSGPLGAICAVNDHLSRAAQAPGFKELTQSIDGVLFYPVDMPLLSPETLIDLVKHGHQRQTMSFVTDSVLPLYMPWRSELRSALKDRLERGHLALKRAVTELAFSTLDINSTRAQQELNNVNTPAEWQALLVNYQSHAIEPCHRDRQTT